jgi:hypothetical protein
MPKATTYIRMEASRQVNLRIRAIIKFGTKNRFLKSSLMGTLAIVLFYLSYCTLQIANELE